MTPAQIHRLNSRCAAAVDLLAAIGFGFGLAWLLVKFIDAAIAIGVI